MASRDKKDLHKTLVTAYEAAKAKYSELYPNESQPFITCTYRSNDEQNSLYAKGRTEKGAKVTNAKGGQSPHNFKPSLAFDIAFVNVNNKLDWNKELFQKFNDCMESVCTVFQWGNDWNGNDKKDKNDFDPPHFQLTNWQNLK